MFLQIVQYTECVDHICYNYIYLFTYINFINYICIKQFIWIILGSNFLIFFVYKITQFK